MSAISRLLLIAAVAMMASPASSEPRQNGRYEMVRVPGADQSGKVLILDTQTGELWTWSEPMAPVYAGRIFPITADGPFARIIKVDPPTGAR